MHTPTRYVFGLLVTLVACGDNGGVDLAPDSPPPEPDGPAAPAPNAVYVLSNEGDANRVVVYERGSDGSLAAGNAYATGGRGSAAGLGSQGSLVFDRDSDRMFAVNAGDNSVSMLALASDGSLELESTVASGGVHPVSVTVRGDLVYVVNGGDANTAANIAGFKIADGALSPISNASRALTAAQPVPAQISFSPDGTKVVVTEKGTNMIVTFPLTDGIAGAPMVRRAVGDTPFGFAWSTGGQMIVSEAFGGAPGLGATSSYDLAVAGVLTAVSSTVESGQTAPCWVEVVGGHAYVTNTGSDTVTAYTVTATGSLELDNVDGVAAASGDTPIDVAASIDGSHLYVLDAGSHAISSYAIAANGSLTRLPDLTGLAPSSVGIAAR
jgi:6-phosphogluconolactonase